MIRGPERLKVISPFFSSFLYSDPNFCAPNVLIKLAIENRCKKNPT